MLTFGSVFAGIGGFDLALESAGATCKWQIEIDANCQQLLADKFPHAVLYSDITKHKEYNLDTVDIICGGWPCQDHSVAGKRGGLAGERSGLFFDLAKLIRDLRPRWFVLENVPGLFSSHKGEDFAVVVKTLTECGYGISWRVLDAQWFGVAQRRRRVFIVGYFGAPCPPQVLFERESGRGDTKPSRKKGEGTPAYVVKGAAIGRKPEAGLQRGEVLEDDSCYTLNATEVHGCLPPRQIPFTVHGEYSTAMTGNGNAKVAFETDKTRSLDSCGGYATNQGGNVIAVLNECLTPCDAESKRVHGADGIAPTIAGSDGGGGQRMPYVAFQQNTRDEVRLIGGDGQVAGALPAQPGMKQQNYVAFPDPAYALAAAEGSRFGSGRDGQDTFVCAHETGPGWWNQSEIASAIRAEGENRPSRPSHIVAAWDEVNITSRANRTQVDPSLPANTLHQRGFSICGALGVRRLTPRECERLQGFPDDWTAGFSDSTRYRMLGNAVAVPVVRWIARRIIAYEQGEL